MAGGKLTPRQKMINMMYLVLTALLALNISKDILQALTKLDDSLVSSVQTVEAQNASIYAKINAAAKKNPQKAEKWQKKALALQKDADALDQKIAKLKDELVTMTGGMEEGVPVGLDNKEKVANYLLKEPQQAAKLKKEIESYRAQLLDLAGDDEQLKAQIQKSFDTSKQPVGTDGTMASWESANFEHYPLAAVLPFLTDLQAKVRKTESDVISRLNSKIGGDDIKISTVEPIVIPNATYITQGDEYEARIMLAAYDDTKDPEIYITQNGEEKKLDPEQVRSGTGFFNLQANAVGEVKWAGRIVLPQLGGDKTYDIPEQTFTVAPPTAVISPTKMNVLYRGVDNPLEIGVPGVAPEKLVVSGAGVSKVGSGEYVANVSNVKGRELDIRVGVQEEEGEVRNIGSKKFRIKGLPPALGSMYKRSGGQLGKGLLKAGKVDARYENFPFDLDLNVVSFEVVVPGFPPEKVNGNTMPSSVKTRIDRMNPGQTLLIRNIKARGPKGVRIPEVASISFDVN